MWRCCFACALVLAVGCDERGALPEVEPCGTGEPTLTPGAGGDGFLEVGPGDPLPLVHGPQGGWHVDLAGRVRDMGEDVAVHATLTVPDLDDLQILGDQQPAYLGLAEHTDETCEGLFWGLRSFLDTDLDLVCALEARTLRYEITVTDLATERAASAAVEVMAALDPIDIESCGG